MKRLVAILAGMLALAMMISPAYAITVAPAGSGRVLVGENVKDDNDVVVKPCDCEPVADPGIFRVFGQNRSLVRVHYEIVEGATIQTTDGTVVGTVLSVQNLNSDGPIVLIVGVDEGVLGSTNRLTVFRNAFYWTGSAAVINTTIDDLRASIQALGAGA
jgi:hypothetical protein